MENWTSIIIGITTSFIASIIFFFSSGLIKRKSNQIIDWVASKNKSYSDKMYKGIAQNKSSFAEMFPSYALLFILLNLLIVISLNLNDRYEIQLQIIEELKENSKIDYETLYQLEEEYSKKQKFRQRTFVWKNIWIYTVLKYFLWGVTFIGTLFLTLFIQRWSRIKEYNLDFRRSLEIITPYVENDKIDKLKSKWGLMSSREDYIEIYDEVMGQVKIVEENKIKPTSNNVDNDQLG